MIRSVTLAALVLLAAVAAIAAGPDPVTAQSGGCVQGCGSGSGATDGARVIAAVRFAAGNGGGGGQVAQSGSSGPGPYANCDWNRVNPDPTDPINGPIYEQLGITVESWFVVCGTPPNLGYIAFPVTGPPPAGLVDDLIQEAYESTPVIAFNPLLSPEGSPAIPLVTQMRTWLWVDDGLWAPVTAAASVPAMSVTVTATPYLAVWHGGDDPGTVHCDQGSEYRTGIGGEAANDDRCTTVFKQASDIRPGREAGLAVHWDVTYTCTAYCAGGDLPDIVTNSIKPVLVTEIQAVSR